MTGPMQGGPHLGGTHAKTLLLGSPSSRLKGSQPLCPSWHHMASSMSQMPSTRMGRDWQPPRPGPPDGIDPLPHAGTPHLPAPPHDVFLEQHLGLEPAVAALGLFCQVVEPGMLQALAGAHPAAGGERSLGHACSSPSPPTTPFSSHPGAPKTQKPAGRNQPEGCAQGRVGLGRTPSGPTCPAWGR